MAISLNLPLPPSINRTSRSGVNRVTGKVYKPGAKLKREYQNWCAIAAMAKGVYHVGMTGRLGIRIEWFFPNERVLDWDAGCKTLCDSLADAIGFNDRMIRRAHIETTVLPGCKPHCEIVLVELEKGEKLE